MDVHFGHAQVVTIRDLDIAGLLLTVQKGLILIHPRPSYASAV